jgi:hypothetical protein
MQDGAHQWVWILDMKGERESEASRMGCVLVVGLGGEEEMEEEEVVVLGLGLEVWWGCEWWWWWAGWGCA